MDYKVLYRKYRPKNFGELIGQDAIKDVLVNSIKLNKIAHAYIFSGLRGTGKTSTAKIFAKTLNCLDNSSGNSCEKCEMCKTYGESADIIEIDAASNNGVEEIRSLRDSVKIAPYNSKYKVYIIDEVHMLSNSAWNAFLKTLEEPPSHVIFILATTEVNKIPDTVKSRCQIFVFNEINDTVMKNYLLEVAKKEKIEIEEDAVLDIVQLARGSLRDALSILDKLSKYNKKITTKLILENYSILDTKKLDDLFNYIKKSDIDLTNNTIEEIKCTGITPLNFINDFIDFLMNKIINKETKDFNDLELIKKIINKLNEIISNFNSVLNPFILIKVELMTINYFPGNNKLEKEEKIEFNNKVTTEQIPEEKIESSKNNNKLKDIRINNSFVKASKQEKENFKDNWEELINELNENDEVSILGFLENVKIEVVSPTNALLSFKTDSEALIFNNNVKEIETRYNKKYKTDYRFIALSQKEWSIEKKKYIDNKSKKYEYIDEISLNNDKSEIEGLASDIFGENIIEIR